MIKRSYPKNGLVKRSIIHFKHVIRQIVPYKHKSVLKRKLKAYKTISVNKHDIQVIQII